MIFSNPKALEKYIKASVKVSLKDISYLIEDALKEFLHKNVHHEVF